MQNLRPVAYLGDVRFVLPCPPAMQTAPISSESGKKSRTQMCSSRSAGWGGLGASTRRQRAVVVLVTMWPKPSSDRRWMGHQKSRKRRLVQTVCPGRDRRGRIGFFAARRHEFAITAATSCPRIVDQVGSHVRHGAVQTNTGT